MVLKPNPQEESSSFIPLDQFLLYGDSITQHSSPTFSASLSDAYIRRLDVLNRGLSGYNTRQALHLLPSIIPPPERGTLRFLTIFFGANDSRLPNTPGGPQQHIPLDEFKENLRKICGHEVVRAQEGVRIMLITPPAVDERMMGENGVPTRKAGVTRKYAAAVRELGKELGVQVVDVWSALIRRAGGDVEDEVPVGAVEKPVNTVLQGCLTDGLHFTPVGYKVLFEEVMGVIGKAWPEQMPERLGMKFPMWADYEVE